MWNLRLSHRLGYEEQAWKDAEHMYSICLHLPQPIYFPACQRKRFVKILVGLCSATRREQKKSRSLTMSCLCLLFGLLTGSQEMIYLLLCKEAPTASQTAVGLTSLAWGKMCSWSQIWWILYAPKIAGWSPSTSAWYPWSCCILVLLLQNEQDEIILKTDWEPSLISKKREKVFGLCRWSAETWSLMLMWHNSSHEQQRSHVLSLLISRSKYETDKDRYLKH